MWHLVHGSLNFFKQGNFLPLEKHAFGDVSVPATQYVVHTLNITVVRHIFPKTIILYLKVVKNYLSTK